ncbi:MAG TPA: SMC-Scp complex subunit ScpB [Vicinamibacterales bacterium]|nr:SMC-Scp complex subunit ScpB [Vicinamibacterales bacterium]
MAKKKQHDEQAPEELQVQEPPPGPSEVLMATIEALIFASPDPMSLKQLTKLLDSEPKEDVKAALDAVRERYDRPGGLQLVEVAGGYQIVTRPELHEWVRRLFHERTTQKLSVAALETLAVIAYKQPVTSPEIAEIRGVNTSGVLATLMDRKLVKIVGRRQVVGRPFMYGTTREFLERFGLNDLSDLPKVEDMSELLGFELPGMDAAPETAALPFDENAEHRTQNGENVEHRTQNTEDGIETPAEDPGKDVIH